MMLQFDNARLVNQVAKDIGDNPERLQVWKGNVENGFSYLIHATDNARHAMAIVMYYTSQRNYMPGKEFGTARFENPKQVNKILADKDENFNRILSQNVKMSLDFRRLKLNGNILKPVRNPEREKPKWEDTITNRMLHWSYTPEQKEEVKKALAAGVPKATILTYFYPEVTVEKMSTYRKKQ